MVNMGTIDMNVTLSRVDRYDRPDIVMFDLDPAPPAGIPECVEVALLIRQVLEALGLESYPKTSGSDGMHVLLPVARRHTFEESRRFVSLIASTLERTHPGLVTTAFLKEKRRGVLVDANQNRSGATTAAVYSVRPRSGAPVSTPLAWDELTPDLDPLAFKADVVLDRVERHGDLFAGVLAGKQSLTKALAAVS
jgi:bifunctional non-homologous end joining protein LigD